MLGSSTTRDWMRLPSLAYLYQVPRDEVVDGHINGCHQTCTWAEVRNLLAQGRHFEIAFYGLNHFQMCEERHSKRILQHRMLLPRDQTLDLWRLYVYAKSPSWYIARSIVASGSDALADTAAIRAELRGDILGKPLRGQTHRWFTPKRPLPKRVRYCSYNEIDVRYKLAATRALFDDLQHLATVSHVLILPDESLSQRGPAIDEAWHAHRSALRDLAGTRPWINLVDMTQGEPWTAARFTDGVHLQRREYAQQRKRLARALMKRDRQAGER